MCSQSAQKWRSGESKRSRKALVLFVYRSGHHLFTVGRGVRFPQRTGVFRVRSSMVEQRPFKPLVPGSSPGALSVSGGIVQRLVCYASNLAMGVRFPLPLPTRIKGEVTTRGEDSIVVVQRTPNPLTGVRFPLFPRSSI
jgi:hypothetical protein